MYKRIINISLAFSVLLFLATGCGKKTEEKQIPLQKKTQHINQNEKIENVVRERAMNVPIVAQSLFQVILYGAVLDITDGHPITNFYFSATPRGLYKKAGSPGHFSGNIAPDVDGKFVLSNLLESTYTLKVDCDNFRTFETNIFLCERESFVDFSLAPLKNITIKGKVVFEATGKIAPNITVLLSPSANYSDLYATNIPVRKTKTDINGKFSFVSSTIKDGWIGALFIDEPGYARAKYYIYKNYSGEEISLLLRDVSCIKGVVKTLDGNPVSNILVNVYNDYHYAPKFGHKNSFSKELDDSIGVKFEYKATSPTTSSGEFIISNVAAPETYCFKIDSEDYFIPLTLHAEPKSMKVNKGAVAEIELIVLPKSKVFLKVCDEKKQPVLNYKLDVMVQDERGSDSYKKQVSLSSDTWYRVTIPEIDNNGKLSLTATANDEKVAATNGVILVAGETNFITMILSSESQISGFVYYPDESPAIDAWLSANVISNDSFKYAYTDYLGYFEIAGLLAKSNDNIEIYVSDKTRSYKAETNVLFGSQDVEIYLSPLPKIFGRVSLDYSDNPATNFTISINNWKTVAFRNDEGKFSVNMSSNRQGTNFIYITSAGYAPKKVYFDFIKNKACNLGEIILAGKPVTITGRVVDQNGKPVGAYVYLLPEDSGELNVRTDSNGKYIFTDLPIEPVKIRAHTFHGTVESGVIHPSPDKLTKVPDLVVYNTNAVVVEITFVLPTGDYASDALVQNIGKITDEKGTIKKHLRFGEYKNWRILYEDKIYRAEDFYVSQNTKELRVKLIGSSEIKVAFSLNGKPMKKDYVRYNYNGEEIYEDIPNGILVVTNRPGKYVFFNERHKVAIVAELYENEDNVVNFKTENSTLNVELPYKASWAVSGMLKINGVKAEIASGGTETYNSKKIFLKNIPAGEYELWVRCNTPSAKTNFTMRATAY